MDEDVRYALFWLALVTIMFFAVVSLAADTCTITANGSVDVYAKVYYLHENPRKQRYVYTTPVLQSPDGVVSPSSIGGLPVAFEWYMRPHGVSPAPTWELVKTCGDVPDSVYPKIFSHTFEGGSTRGWDKVVGDE